MSFTAELEVSPILRAQLEAIGKRLGPVVHDALVDIGLEIANDARPRAAYKTGTLRRSIEVKELGPGEVRVGSELPYAARIEFGFSGRDSLGRVYSQGARPYLRPSLDENRQRLRQAIADAVSAALR